MGYREGRDAGDENQVVLQRGFDDGYAHTFQLAFQIGQQAEYVYICVCLQQ
jgi:hypothetical protein